MQLAGYFFLAFGARPRPGSAHHVWHVPWLACLLALLAQNHAQADASGALGARPRGPRALLSVTCFWPLQITKWKSGLADVVLAPVKAAEQATEGRRALVLWQRIKPPDARNW